MNIIANDCVGGFIYKKLEKEYGSPFIWTVLRYKDFKNILLHYEEIDFKNVRYDETPNYLFPYYMSQLVVDEKFRLFFPHHVKLDGYAEIQPYNNVKGQSNYVYEHMDEYIVEHYNKRVERMVGSEPIFVFSQENRNTKEELEDLLKLNNNKHKFIFITKEKDLIKYQSDMVKIIFKPQNEIAQDTQAEFIVSNFKDFLV